MGGSGRIGKKSIRKRSSAAASAASEAVRTVAVMRRTAPGARERERERESRNAVSAMFDEFADGDPNPDRMGPEALETFFEALELDPLDVTALIFAWKLKAKTPCEFSRTEFVEGCLAMDVDTLQKLRKKVTSLCDMIEAPEDFRSFYAFAFDYNKPPGQRSLPIDTARVLWPLLFGDRFALLDLWLKFLEPRSHAISRDSYILLLDFATTILPDLSNFDENDAWPVLIDEFVDFVKPRVHGVKDSGTERVGMQF
jgi:DCN1-like protein 1/2